MPFTQLKGHVMTQCVGQNPFPIPANVGSNAKFRITGRGTVILVDQRLYLISPNIQEPLRDRNHTNSSEGR